jgi:hypothetical protein
MSIEYNNIKRYDKLSFEDYLLLPGVGHSWLKRAKNGICEDFVPTEKMNLGSVVDTILTDSVNANMSHSLYEPALYIAAKIQMQFGQFLKHMDTQVSYCANVKESQTGLQLAVTGRLDYLLGNVAILDLKVTDQGSKKNPIPSLMELISFMGYDNQLYHYGKMANVLKKYILIYSKPLKEAFLFPRLTKEEDILKAEEWWAGKILDYGSVS